MSRIGRQPVVLPEEVQARVDGNEVIVKGPKGELRVQFHRDMAVQLRDKSLQVVPHSDDQRTRAFHGLTRSLIANAVHGVHQGFEKRLVVVGIGYRAEVQGENLRLSLGFSHPVVYTAPHTIEFDTEAPPRELEGAQTSIVVRGVDKQLVGQVAAEIRSFRPPEPYKGKGIRYANEVVRRKAGKAAVT